MPARLPRVSVRVDGPILRPLRRLGLAFASPLLLALLLTSAASARAQAPLCTFRCDSCTVSIRSSARRVEIARTEGIEARLVHRRATGWGAEATVEREGFTVRGHVPVRAARSLELGAMVRVSLGVELVAVSEVDGQIRVGLPEGALSEVHFAEAPALDVTCGDLGVAPLTDHAGDWALLPGRDLRYLLPSGELELRPRPDAPVGATLRAGSYSRVLVAHEARDGWERVSYQDRWSGAVVTGWAPSDVLARERPAWSEEPVLGFLGGSVGDTRTVCVAPRRARIRMRSREGDVPVGTLASGARFVRRSESEDRRTVSIAPASGPLRPAFFEWSVRAADVRGAVCEEERSPVWGVGSGGMGSGELGSGGMGSGELGTLGGGEGTAPR